MKKINNIISSSIAPKDTDALWINPEDRTINIFDNGWGILCDKSGEVKEDEGKLTESETIESEVTQ